MNQYHFITSRHPKSKSNWYEGDYRIFYLSNNSFPLLLQQHMKALLNPKFWLILGLVFLLLAPALGHLAHAGIINWEPRDERPVRMVLHGGAALFIILGIILLAVKKK
jgi:hypothetical protein